VDFFSGRSHRNPDYRHKHFVILWLAALIAFTIFYYSNYAVVGSIPSWPDVPVFGFILHGNPLSVVVFLVRFQAVRFLSNQFTVKLFTLICLLVLVANLWQLIHKRERENEAAAALWGSLALFSLGVAVVVFFGRHDLADRYSPGADGFWTAFAALALMVLRERAAHAR
jgi:hypothetical protein